MPINFKDVETFLYQTNKLAQGLQSGDFARQYLFPIIEKETQKSLSESFKRESEPDGKAWAPHAPMTVALGKHKIGQSRGRLLNAVQGVKYYRRTIERNSMIMAIGLNHAGYFESKFTQKTTPKQRAFLSGKLAAAGQKNAWRAMGIKHLRHPARPFYYISKNLLNRMVTEVIPQQMVKAIEDLK